MFDSISGFITLLTDFSGRDGYVGVMKGVIAGIHPGARTIDISHEIPPQDVRSASFLIERSYRYFPRGTVHVVVVDPGVGSERKGLILQFQGHYFIGPDNGVFTGVLKGAETRALTNPKYWLEDISKTFHGRDIFAPVAAHLTQGVPLAEFGATYAHPVLLEEEKPERTSKGWSGRVVYVDRFGNLVTNLGPEQVASLQGQSAVATLEDGSRWPLVNTYSDAPSGGRCAVIGGFERLELSIHGGDAAKASGAVVGCRTILLGRIQ